MREEKEMAAPQQMAEAIFLFWQQKLISDPRQRSVPIGHSDQAQNTLLGTQKFVNPSSILQPILAK